MVILVDTREQRPFWSRKPCIRACTGLKKATLNVGDYTTVALLGKYHVERKSLQDLYGTIIHNHARFRREIIRARDKGIKIIMVVEGTHKDFINKNFPRGDQRKASTTMLRKIIVTIKRRYDLEIIFCRDRARAKDVTFKKLKFENSRCKK